MKERWTYRGNKYTVDPEIEFPATRKALFYGGLIGMPLALCGLLQICINSVFEGNGVIFVLMGLVELILGPVLARFFYSINKKLWDDVRNDYLKEQKEKEKFKKEHPNYKEEQFYVLCRQEKILDATQKGNIERIKLLAKREGINGTEKELVEMYEIGKKDVLKTEKKDLINVLKEEEKEIDDKNQKYITYSGVEKLKRYCEDKISECKATIWQCERDEDTIYNGGEVIYNSSKQKETDWAIAGGIASGLGGIGAGVSAAMDAQARNAEVRENNENLARSIAQVQVATLQQVWDKKRVAESNLRYWTEKLDNAKITLVENLPQDVLLKELNPAVKEIKVSESGAVRLKLKYARPKTLKIYDNIPAYIDGSFKAVLKANGEIAGVAYATLPYDGSDGYSIIEAVCRKVSIPAEKYDVSFEANNLWAMERK